MMPSDQDLDALIKRLHLANARRAWRDLTRRAEQEEWSYRDFLALLISEEVAHRQQTRLNRLVRRARFPFLKTIDDFNFLYQSTVRLSLLGSVLAPDFVTEGRCIIFGGKTGRGKTHLAVAIAYRAIQNGFDARCVTAAELIDDLSTAFRSGGFTETLATYVHPGVLVVDEVGYLTYGTDAANMLFHVVNDRHRKKRAMVFTTNKALTAWGRVLHDDDLAHAIVDRILERGRMIMLDGPSMRTKHLGLDDSTSTEALDQPARISGIEAPEFPEPTLSPSDAPFPVVATLFGLTFVTGLIDGVSFLGLGHVFTANMTGNVVFVGFALGGAADLSIRRSLAALGAFASGSVVGGFVTSRRPRAPARNLLIAMYAEILLLSVAVMAALVTGTEVTSVSAYLLIVTTAVAMGLRNAVVRTLAIPDLTTTVLTLTVTGLAADSRLAGGAGARSGRRILAILAMCGGALTGAMLLRTFGIAITLIGTTLVVAGLASYLFSSERSKNVRGH